MAESVGSAVLTVGLNDAPLRAGLAAAQQYASKAGTAIGSAFAQSTSTITSLTIKLNSLQSELANVAIGSKRFQELRREIEATEKSLGKTVNKGSGFVGSLVSNLAGIGLGAAGFQFAKDSVAAAAELETISRRLSVTLGTQGVGGALTFTRDLADQLGLSFVVLTKEFSSFTAAASASGVTLEQQRSIFEAVAKAAQVFGLNNEELQGTFKALEQIAAKGTVSLEELRGQLGDRLPIAVSAAANGLGITQRELFKLIETGNLASRDFFPALTKGLNDLTANAPAVSTTAQNFNKLKNEWNDLQVSFGTNLLPAINESIRIFIDRLDDIGRKGRADKLGFSSGFLNNVSDEAISAVENLKVVEKQFGLTQNQANALFTDAFAEIQQGGFVQSPAFLDEKRIELVNDKVRELARLYREANPDRSGELVAQTSAAQKLLDAEAARAEVAEKLLEPSRQRLSDLQAIQGLEGLALEEAKVQLSVDKARAEQKRAISDFDKKLVGAGFDRDSPAVIKAAARVEAAGNSLKAALIEGSNALTESAKDAAAKFIDASRQLLDARLKLSGLQANPGGLNQFLTPQEQFKSTREAILRLGPDLEAGIARATKLLNIPTGQANERFQGLRDIFAQARQGIFASQAGFDRVAGFLSDLGALENAVSGLNQAQESVNTINKELVGVNTSLRDQVAALVQKAWNVQVNVQGAQASAYGDVLNGALSPA